MDLAYSRLSPVWAAERKMIKTAAATTNTAIKAKVERVRTDRKGRAAAPFEADIGLPVLGRKP